MFNFVSSNCYECKREFLMSISEKSIFGYGYCDRCLDPRVKHIRAKIVMGYYDIDTINAEIVNKFVEKELLKSERRRYPRVVYKEKVK